MPTQQTQNLYDIDAIKRNNSLVEVVERELGRAAKRPGGRTMQWRCPFHQEDGPSFTVWPDEDRFKCFGVGCGVSGSVIDFVMLRRGLDVPAACEALGGTRASTGKRKRTNERRPISTGTPWQSLGANQHEPALDWQRQAKQVMEECAAALWLDTEAAEKARAYLAARGLREGILKEYRIGFNATDRLVSGLWVKSGIVIPNLHASTGVLYSLNVRRLSGELPKYMMASGSKNAPFGLAAIRGKQVVFVLEGPFDTLLVLQTLADMGEIVTHVGAFTLGAASSRDLSPWLSYLIGPSRYLLAMDNDDAGEASRCNWLTKTARARRWPPPVGCKDISEYWRKPWPYGGDQALRTWIRCALQHPYNTLAQPN